MTNYNITAENLLDEALMHCGTYYSEDLQVEINVYRNDALYLVGAITT